MSLTGAYEPSPASWIAEQVERYERTDGADGGTLQDRPVVILTTRGAKSGKIRKTPLMRVTDGTCYAVVASQGGAPTNPSWYRNILADPHVSLRDGGDVRDYVARQAEGEERETWWAVAVETWPDYETYQKKTEREIPVVILEPSC
ncbi:nitroreductase family deazaflavin-dependent oxidoreductase [Streptomyces turgidiscabies]|uniref:Deazaflavin-dependent nitroreductase family protein n=1 Tax=Streptomyces turgidiscabies (strain Car8) TaxID=698760 RepID=L7FEL2_STRT8|nr:MULTISPECIES: nitroreductase family deazaflavin-dependent oxidoreductase [Streptomyces]ELP69536.1 deazaflavin-dependent nitroreductase family protein [Streptomyces turgidiscabies Car8]MDX3496132.1 nitroreductase family deazaflavin-dependent oxidoreductase [Streptomyces turgidiscabies]GAQ75371.1 putative nitroreductase/MT1609 [Streptomyces turgidiscabies]